MTCTLRLEPGGQVITAGAGTPLRDLLFPYGVEFPCGGEGTCGGCEVRLTTGETILACQHSLTHDLTVQIGTWHHTILTDHHAAIPHGTGRGIAVDLGTTTVVAQLIEGETGAVLGTRAERNAQAKYGADVMTRLGHALTPSGLHDLHNTINAQISRMVRELTPDAVPVVITGNTAMHHLYEGLDPEPLTRAPFELTQTPTRECPFIPPVAGFVGSDILAGIITTGMDSATELSVLLDLGTNGEIVVGTGDHLLCASTAAGPAFEGGRIRCGMTARTGAIAAAEIRDGNIETMVIGHTEARGICGSGLVDITAAALHLGLIAPTGRIQTGTRTIPLRDGVYLQQSDIRELQLAKAATAAGLATLLTQLDAEPADIRHLYLAGAFGNYVRQSSAHRIGLIPFNDPRVHPVGNASLAGAKRILFTHPDLQSLRKRIHHIPLHASPTFEETYIRNMRFPSA